MTASILAVHSLDPTVILRYSVIMMNTAIMNSTPYAAGCHSRAVRNRARKTAPLSVLISRFFMGVLNICGG